jgi:hypothetical protein
VLYAGHFTGLIFVENFREFKKSHGEAVLMLREPVKLMRLRKRVSYPATRTLYQPFLESQVLRTAV